MTTTNSPSPTSRSKENRQRLNSPRTRLIANLPNKQLPPLLRTLKMLPRPMSAALTLILSSHKTSPSLCSSSTSFLLELDLLLPPTSTPRAATASVPLLVFSRCFLPLLLLVLFGQLFKALPSTTSPTTTTSQKPLLPLRRPPPLMPSLPVEE